MEPFLRTLVPALRQLERSLRRWLEGAHRKPLSTIMRAALEGEADNLYRQAQALDVDRPLLVIMLMGGTGVGKSTLLNALAGAEIAKASLARPTTRESVVYYHESLKPERLDPALQQCHLAPHNRAALEQKILVDTPDLDSNDLSNRDKLIRVLPVADIVLHVGSQEKYHDKLGWDLFLQQRRRRAFAFVLNKWDRCLQPEGSGLRPDEDWLRDLQSEGFQDPLLFRTCARLWVNGTTDQETSETESGSQTQIGNQDDRVARPESSKGVAPPEGEQFQELVRWLETGLTRLEIEAIKARGIHQLLLHLEHGLQNASPPDVADAATKVKSTWERILAEEAAGNAEVLVNTLEPYQREIEHHFSLEGQRRFHGLMAMYLHLFTRTRYVGSTLRDRFRVLPKIGGVVNIGGVARPGSQTQFGNQGVVPASWDLYTFTSACSRVAGERHLDARSRAFVNRLQVEADKPGFPVVLRPQPTENASRIDWRQRYSQILIEVLDQIEQHWSRPTGLRRWVQGTVIWLANTLPLITLVGVCILLLWQYLGESGDRRRTFAFGDFLLPVIVVFIVMVILHVLITLVLPMRWPAMRGEFQRQLERRLQSELEKTYLPIPLDVADALERERSQIEHLISETREVAGWVEQREHAAQVGGFYGK